MLLRFAQNRHSPLRYASGVLREANPLGFAVIRRIIILLACLWK